MNWLDTQTKEILQKVVEPKLAPPKTAEFTLVLVHCNGSDHTRLVRAIRRINECEESEAEKAARHDEPRSGLIPIFRKETHFGDSLS